MSPNTHDILMKARLERGYTQEQLARAINVSRPTYINIESGKKELTLRQYETISSILSINIEDLLGGADSHSAFFNVLETTKKYKQIILNSLKYGSDEGDKKITKTKLAKMVYLADFIWYYKYKTPMSGVKYRKLPRGPVADMYFRALDELEEDRMILRENTPKGAIMFSLVEDEAPVSQLSEAEILLIKNIGESWRGKSTQDIVDFTHEQLPWKTCGDGEIIPYDLITQEEPIRVYGAMQIC